ncbi:MAG: transposase [Candidatus Marinamargulisbacteria bacterium]
MHQNRLKASISILVRNDEFVSDSDKKKLKALFKLSPSLKRAYKLCRKFTSVFNSPVPKRSASKKINNWISIVKDSSLTCFDKFAISLIDRQKEIVNYFKARQNSGFVEGLNNKAKVTQRKCYGLADPTSFFLRLVLDLSGYRLLAQPMRNFANPAKTKEP